MREVPPRRRCHRRIRFDADDLHTAVSKRHCYAPGATARIDGAAVCPNEPHDIVNELVRVRRADAIVKLGILSEHEPLLARHDFGPNGRPDRALPGRDCDSAPFFGFDVTHRLRQLPAMATQVLEQARTLTVFPGSWFFEHASTELARRPEGRIDVRYANLDDVRDDARAGGNLIAVYVGDHYGTVRSNTQLSAVRVADPHPLLEAEGRLQPRDRCSHVRIDQHRSDRGRRRRTIRQHR